MPDSVFFGLNLLTNDTIRLKFKVGELSQYGNIFVPLELEDGVRQVIVELITEKDKVVDKQIVNEDDVKISSIIINLIKKEKGIIVKLIVLSILFTFITIVWT